MAVARIVLVPHERSSHFTKRECTVTEPLKVGRSVGKERSLTSNLIFDCPHVSINHALVWFENGKFFIMDTKSHTGTFVNEASLSSSKKNSSSRKKRSSRKKSSPKELKAMDIVQFGVDKTREGPSGIVAIIRLFIDDNELSRVEHPTQHFLPIIQAKLSLTEEFKQLDAQYGNTNSCQRSIAITAFFKDLSLQMTLSLPDKIVHYLQLCGTAARVHGIQDMMDDVLHMTDKAGVVAFLHTYIPKISDADKHHDELITYLADTHTLQMDLDKATHLDIKDMVNAIKKGVLKQLFELVQRSQSDVLDMDDSCRSIKEKLTRYDWICQLRHNQRKIHRLLEVGQERSSALPKLLEEIGIDRSLQVQASIDDVLGLLRHYGVMEHVESGTKNHTVVTIKAANLSLKDLLSTPELVHSDEVRFLCTECFYLDTFMDVSEDATWSAKNVAIKAPKILVMTDDSRIDLSGTHGVNGSQVAGKHRANNGQILTSYGPGDHGSHGEHGTLGKSGGNILICADEIIHSEKLTLISCGGNGGDGQDGGDGQNGRAKPSELDDLSDWPTNFARLNWNTASTAQQTIIDKMKGYSSLEHVAISKRANYLYGKAPSGVQILFGSVDDFCYRYGFLLSMSKDGESADGGNAGMGGKAGGGGQAGVIDVIKLDGSLYDNHNMKTIHDKGQDGKPGKTGKYGERSIADRETDHLYVDGAGLWGTTKTYHDLIEVKPWKRSSKTGQLGSGYYYCKQEVSQLLDPFIDDDHIGFFKTRKNCHCPTKHNCQAEHGKANDQTHIIATTKSKPIDQRVIHIDYQLFANQTLVVQDRSTLLQSLEQLEHTLYEKLQELESAHEKQQHKQMRHVNHKLGNHSVNVVHIKPVSKGIIAELPIPFKSDKLKHVVDANPWISQTDITFFQSDLVPIQDKYVKIREIIKNRLDVLQQQTGDEVKKETSRFERFKEKWKTTTFSPIDSGYIYHMFDAIFVPIVRVMHFEHTQAIDDCIWFVSTVQEKIHSQFHAQIDAIRTIIHPLLFKQYRWCTLADIYDKHITTIPSAVPEHIYQSKSVTVYREVLEQTTIKQLNKFALSLHKGNELKPYHGSLPNYGSSCNTILPLRQSTQSALELLMVFINDHNTDAVYFPDILSAVQEEYATFCCTIVDLDLLFVMTYLQEKLVHLLDRTYLEDLFCEGVLSKVNDHTLKKEGYIIYNGMIYRIDTVVNKSDHVVCITMKCKDSDKTWGEWLKEKALWSKAKTHHLIIQTPDQVTLDDTPIAFPSGELLVSPVDINEVWDQLQLTVMKKGWIPNDRVFETLSLPDDANDDYKHQLIAILQHAREAQDIPYDVFSFYPPSQWVEQLIFYAIRRHYQHHNPNFVTDVQQAISGLSLCVDKTLYFTFFDKFLHGSMFKSDHYSTDILETLQFMKFIFIDRQLCTLVTHQGIAQAWPQFSAEMILNDLEDTGLIDDTGAFLSDVTPDTLQSYCRTRSIHPNYLNTIYTMQRYTHDLSDKELSFWRHKIRELCLLLELQDMVDGDMDDYTSDILLMYAQQLVQNYGNKTASKFIRELNSKQEKVPATLLLNLFQKCACKKWIFEIVIDQLIQNATRPLAEILEDLQKYDWKSAHKQQRKAVEIIAFIKSQLPKVTQDLLSKLDAVTSKVDDIKKKHSLHSQITEFQRSGKRSLPDIDPVIESFLVVPICEYNKENIQDWAAAFRKSTIHDKQTLFEHPLFTEAFAVICRGVTLFFETKGKEGIFPRDTQIVASLLFFLNLSVQGGASQGTRLMQQISTGEGKTTIISMTAIFKALLGETVDIVTGSSVLATRDAAEQQFLYSLFSISVSHCCHDELTKRRQAYESDVIYGDIGSFQRDILETYFYDHMIRTAHGYDNVLIDEVDSMLVDKGETMLYLPHALPDLNALDQVYLEIWSLVNAQDFIGFPDEQAQLYDYLKLTIIGGLPSNAFTAIPDISETQSSNIHRCCIDIGLINRDDHCLTTKDSAEIQRQVCTMDLIPSHLQQETILIIQQHLDTRPLLQTVPKALHPFVKKSLKSWIQSAVNAKFFQPNKQYIIDIDHRESAGDRYPKIIIMDNETGVEQESSEWGNGLHQFLQLKHHLRLSTESLKAVYMSNISFFIPRYTNIMGVTGTLGSSAEHALFNKLYKNTLLLVLPTNTPSRLQIDPPACCPTIDSWEAAIDDDVQEKLNQGRAVLLICEDVERAKCLHQYLKYKHPPLDPELYTSSHQEKLEVTGDSKPGRLIIATNLAGRGTDLKLNDKVKDNGGLHVCLSYLPTNVRVEQQAYGRAARMGDPGTCKMIFHDKEGDLSYAISKRDLCEARRVADIEADYYHNIRLQEELFEKFTAEYDTIKAIQKDKPEGRPKLDYCLDCWAYFLDRYTDVIESIPSKATNEERELEKARLWQAFDKEVKKEIDPNLVAISSARLMQLGHLYMKQAVKKGDKYKDAGNKKKYKKAIAAYQKAKAQNPGDPFAMYYEAAAQLNEDTGYGTAKKDRSKIKQTFYKLAPLFQDKIKRCRGQMYKLQLANRHHDQSLTVGGLYFDEQKQHEIEVYHQFIESMQDIIGKEITPKTFNHADWGEDGAVIVFQMVKEMFPLKECRVSPRYHLRLKALLDTETSYHTYKSKIEKRIKSLMQQTPVTKDHFEGIFPDKHLFWDQLKKHQVITHESVTKKDESTAKEERVGYWNPTTDLKGVEFKACDCIDADSFDWIDGLSDNDRKVIVSHLKFINVLNQNGHLIEFNLSKPLHLPKAFTPYYKHIKDTLWIQSIYRFVLYHLQECVVIDRTHDIEDSSSSDTALSDQLPLHDHEAIPQAFSISVVDILISMNPAMNPFSASDIQHIQVPLSGKAAPLLTPNISRIVPFNSVTHMPNEVFNQKFLQQLHDYNLRVTNVSGDGLNCMIHAMIQHAKCDYQTHCFKEDADMIRKSLQEWHPEISGMLHPDDYYAEVVLTLVNDHCSSTIKMVSVVIASSDGPIIYGGTSDKRFSAEGRHVVIWQQGNHYVSIVHHHEMVLANSRRRITEHDVQQTIAVPKLTQHQLRALEELGIVKKNQRNDHVICAGLDMIECVLHGTTSMLLSEHDKEQVRIFLRLKLEIDFKTLNRSERQLLSNQHHVLYNDLCQYAVIKPVKMKEDAGVIERVTYDRFGYKSDIHDRKPYFDITVLNEYLKQKIIEELNGQQQMDLELYLQNTNIIITESFRETAANFVLNKGTSSPTLRVNITKDKLIQTHSSVLCSATFLSKEQRCVIRDYLTLMIQLKENVDTIISILKSQQSTIRELETPEITLRKLSDVFEDTVQDKGDVLGWFSDNQCDLIINLAEQKWSWKTIITAVGAIALGVAQIALGAVLLVASSGTGSFFCEALISEGISDMIFGIEGLVKGHCNWTQYWENKIMSLAITVATAGLGAVFARGREASKYAFKAFGNASKQLMKATAKETGESVSKILAKQVGKKIVKDVAGATVEAGINMATEAIVDQLSQAIASMSDSLIDCFDTMCNDEEFNKKMSTYLQQQDPHFAEMYLHQITTRILQRRTFLDLWDNIENMAEKGANVLTQAHGNATSHLQMHGEKLKGQRFMKGITYVSRFAPLVTETMKGGMIKIKMEQVKTDLIHSLEERSATKCTHPLHDEARIKEIKDKEISAMKLYFSKEVSQRGKTIVTTGLQIVGQELKKHAIKVGKEGVVDPLKGHIDISQLNNYERKYEAAKADKNHSQIKKYEGKLQQLMAHTRSPEVFARMIEHHDALLGPAFAVPALEKVVGHPIQIQTEDGKPILNVQQHYSDGEPIVVKFIPGKDGQPGHYFYGKEKVSSEQHGNNCLIHAVLAGAGQTEMNDAGNVRKLIAEACRTSNHPCHDYIKRGIARNYIQIGVVGAGETLKLTNGKLTGKASWEPDMDQYVRNDWLSNPENATRSGIDISKWTQGSSSLQDLGLHRCHRISEKSIHKQISRTVKTKNVANLRFLRRQLLPTISEVERGRSHFKGKAKKAFLETYKGTDSGKRYLKRVAEVNKISKRLGKRRIVRADILTLARHFSNSAVNVGLGDSRTNPSVGKAMDFNPDTPKSEGLFAAFENKPAFFPPRQTESGAFKTSFFSGKPTTEKY